MVATMRDYTDAGAAGPGLSLCEKRASGRASGYCKPRLTIDKPQTAFSNLYSSSSGSSSIALDLLVEVALSPTDSQQQQQQHFSIEPSKFDNVSTQLGNDLPGSPAIARSDAQGAMEYKDDSPYKKLRHHHQQYDRNTQPGAYNLGNSQQQLIAMEAQKLKRLNDQVSQLRKRVHVDHRAKRFTPRFKSLLDISC